jgi:hypothetical protein
MSSGSKKKEPRYICLSEAKASHSHKIWTEDSTPVPDFLQMGLSHTPIICRCLLNVLWPVSRPIAILDWVLLKDNNLGPCSLIRARDQFSSLSLCATGTTPHCQMMFLHPAFHFSSYSLPGDPQERFRSNKPLNRTTPCEPIGDFISSHTSMTRDPI